MRIKMNNIINIFLSKGKNKITWIDIHFAQVLRCDAGVFLLKQRVKASSMVTATKEVSLDTDFFLNPY